MKSGKEDGDNQKIKIQPNSLQNEKHIDPYDEVDIIVMAGGRGGGGGGNSQGPQKERMF